MIEMALGGAAAVVVTILGAWWAGKRSGRKDERSKINAQRHEQTERAIDIGGDVLRGGAESARDSLHERIN